MVEVYVIPGSTLTPRPVECRKEIRAVSFAPAGLLSLGWRLAVGRAGGRV